MPRARSGSPKGSKGSPKGSKGSPKGSKGSPKGSKGSPKGSKGSSKGSKGSRSRRSSRLASRRSSQRRSSQQRSSQRRSSQQRSPPRRNSSQRPIITVPGIRHLTFAELQQICNLGRVLGQGSQAQVKICTNADQKYAVKMIPWAHIESGLAEARITAAITHPNVIRILYTSQDDEYYYIVLEYCDTDLFVLSRQVRLTQVVPLVRQICYAVQAVHRAGYIHRDLKMENLLIRFIGNQTVVKLADFGLAAPIGYSPYELAGTIGYMAPEQYGRNYDQRVDIWAIGVICYELIRRQYMFEDDVTAEKLRNFSYIDTLERNIRDYNFANPNPMYEAARHFIFHCVRPNPDDRWEIRQLLAHPFLDSSKPLGPDKEYNAVRTEESIRSAIKREREDAERRQEQARSLERRLQAGESYKEAKAAVRLDEEDEEEEIILRNE